MSVRLAGLLALILVTAPVWADSPHRTSRQENLLQNAGFEQNWFNASLGQTAVSCYYRPPTPAWESKTATSTTGPPTVRTRPGSGTPRCPTKARARCASRAPATSSNGLEAEFASEAGRKTLAAATVRVVLDGPGQSARESHGSFAVVRQASEDGPGLAEAQVAYRVPRMCASPRSSIT